MSEFNVGDRVRDVIRDGSLVRVKWDDSIVEDGMYAKDIVALVKAAA